MYARRVLLPLWQTTSLAIGPLLYVHPVNYPCCSLPHLSAYSWLEFSPAPLSIDTLMGPMLEHFLLKATPFNQYVWSTGHLLQATCTRRLLLLLLTVTCALNICARISLFSGVTVSEELVIHRKCSCIGM